MHGMRGTSDGRVASNVSLSAYFCSVHSRHTSPAPFCFLLCFVLYAVISVVVEGVTTHEPPPRPTS